MTQSTKGDPLCSFCGKRQHEVEKLIAGPGVYICNECVALCGDIVVEDRAEKEAKAMEDKKDADPPKAPEREPTVADLVANLRAACDGGVPIGAERPATVTLPTELVLAIADGIEMAAQGPSLSDDYAPDEIALLAKQAAKEIVKLIVTRLFEPAKAEGEKALEAAKRLGVTEEQAKSVVAPTSALEKWMPMVLGTAGLAIGGMLPWLMGTMGKRKGGLGG